METKKVNEEKIRIRGKKCIEVRSRADERAKTLKKIWRIWRKRDWALDAYKYIEAELKKVEKVEK